MLSVRRLQGVSNQNKNTEPTRIESLRFVNPRRTLQQIKAQASILLLGCLGFITLMIAESATNGTLPSDTKLLLTKNYSEIIIFEKLRISRVISGKSLSFTEILRAQFPSKITKNNSRGIIFVIISCQRVSILD